MWDRTRYLILVLTGFSVKLAIAAMDWSGKTGSYPSIDLTVAPSFKEDTNNFIRDVLHSMKAAAGSWQARIAWSLTGSAWLSWLDDRKHNEVY